MTKRKLIENALNEPAKAIGNTLSNLWNATIGHWSTHLSEKQNIKYSYKLEDFKNSLEEKLNKIPPAYLAEPKLNIVGPAFEATKYHLEEDAIREMFENLLISSVDDRKSSKVLPSFVRIITEMSPLDAQLLLEIYSSEDNAIPAVNLSYQESNKQGIHLHSNVIEKAIDCEYIDLDISLINLQRIGLVDVDFSIHLTDSDRYNYIYDHELYLTSSEETGKVIQIKKGVVRISSYGLSFSNICLNQNL